MGVESSQYADLLLDIVFLAQRRDMTHVWLTNVDEGANFPLDSSQEKAVSG